jgi:DNA-binding LacI/PurR family transcriptional regulator
MCCLDFVNARAYNSINIDIRKSMPSRTNSNDVARLAGVSRSTVSRVFTDGAYASAETSERVMKAADQLGYSPNAIARSLSMNRTSLIGVIVGELDNPFYADILQVIGVKLQERRLASLLFVANPSAMDTLIPQVLSYRVDGVIISGATLSSKMAMRCQSAGIPVVLVNRYTDSDLISSVVGDNVDGAGQVARLFAERGYRRIGFMAGLPEASSSRDREHGFRIKLADFGLSVSAREVGSFTLEGGARAARAMLCRPDRPDAVFCANDMMATATIDIARTEFNLRIPEDLAVAGYDNSSLAGMLAYQLTSVDQNTTLMAEAALENLLQPSLGAKPPAQVVRIPSKLVERASTTLLASN